MNKRKTNKIVRRILFQILIIHAVANLLHVIANNFGNPLFKVTGTWPVFIEVLILSLVGLVMYMILGAAYAAVKTNKRTLYIALERVTIYFVLLIMAIYAVSYFLAQQYNNHNYMLVYSIANAWFGTYMFRLVDEKLYSLWWMIGAVIPGLGLYLGVKFSLFKQEVIK